MSTATAPAAAPAGMIDLSTAAARKVKELLSQQENTEGLYLRLGVRGGGCSGFSYVLELDRDVDEKYDRVYEIQGVPVVIDRKSLLFLAGTTLDYAGELHVIGSDEGGFIFKNPNAAKTCGCGTSFQA
jgi:iron-sulfur cluster assembly accessory protein